MTNIIPFKSKVPEIQANEEQSADETPHMHGEARCNNCGHRWVAVLPTGREDEPWRGSSLECRECGAEKGVFVKHCVFSGEGITHWTCQACAGILFTVAKVEGRNPAMCCAGCGNVSDALDLFPGM